MVSCDGRFRLQSMCLGNTTEAWRRVLVPRIGSPAISVINGSMRRMILSSSFRSMPAVDLMSFTVRSHHTVETHHSGSLRFRDPPGLRRTAISPNVATTTFVLRSDRHCQCYPFGQHTSDRCCTQVYGGIVYAAMVITVEIGLKSGRFLMRRFLRQWAQFRGVAQR